MWGEELAHGLRLTGNQPFGVDQKFLGVVPLPVGDPFQRDDELAEREVGHLFAEHTIEIVRLPRHVPESSIGVAYQPAQRFEQAENRVPFSAFVRMARTLGCTSRQLPREVGKRDANSIRCERRGERFGGLTRSRRASGDDAAPLPDSIRPGRWSAAGS